MEPSEITRQENLRRLGAAHNLDPARVQRWIDAGTSFTDATREIIDATRRNPPRPTTAPASDANVLGLTEREIQRYSICGAINQELENRHPGQGEPPAFETEVSRALERHVPEKYKRQGGILVPTGILGRREVVTPLEARAGLSRQGVGGILTRDGLDTLTSTKGAEAKFTDFQGFIELLRARAMVLQLGATYLPGLQGDAALVKQTAAAIAEWVIENPGADQDITELALSLVTLSAKTLMGSTYYTRQLLRQAAIAVDALVENDLGQVHARAIDRAALHGTGAGDNQPEGLYLLSGVNAVAFGGPITFAKVVEMETGIAEADADLDRMAYLTTPAVRGAARQTRLLSDSTDSLAIWTGGVRDGVMNGYPAAASTQVRTDLGATPTPTPVEHGILFGAWPELLVGEWGILELVVDPYTKKKQGLIEVTSFQMVDCQCRHPEAFSKGTGLTVS